MSTHSDSIFCLLPFFLSEDLSLEAEIDAAASLFLITYAN